MTEQMFVEKLIDVIQPMTNEPRRISTIGLLLKGARKLSGRNLMTGFYEMNQINEESFEQQLFHFNLFSGLTNYLIFLEQIGIAFKLKENDSNIRNGIALALKNFSSLAQEKDKINAIRALRNCLTHNYGLVSGKDSNYRHKFTLSFERNSQIIKFPLKMWLGDFSDKDELTNTTVYVYDLIELVENVYFKLKDLVKRDFKAFHTFDIDELKARFTIIH